MKRELVYEEVTSLPGERQEFSPEINYLLEAFALVTNSELATQHTGPSQPLYCFNSDYEAHVIDRVTLKTRFHEAKVKISRFIDPNAQGMLAQFTMADVSSYFPSKKRFRNGLILGACIDVLPSGDVEAVVQRPSRLASRTESPQERRSELRLYDRLGLLSIVGGFEIRRELEQRRYHDIPLSPYHLEPDSIVKLTDFLINGIAGQIRPGVGDQKIIVDFDDR